MKHLKITHIILILITVLPCRAEVADSTQKENRHIDIQLQYAGNLGLISGGFGRSYLQNKLELYMIYGYLPKKNNGATVHTLALKSVIPLFEVRPGVKFNNIYYTGAAVLYGITNNTHLIGPPYYPAGEFRTNAFHGTCFFGSRVNFNPPYSRRHINVSVFAELGTIDFQLISSLATKQIAITDIWNISAGMVFRLTSPSLLPLSGANKGAGKYQGKKTGYRTM